MDKSAKIAQMLKEVFPNIIIESDEDYIGIAIDIVENSGEHLTFKESATLFLTFDTEDGENPAKLYADIVPVDGPPIGPYYVGNEEVHPKQKYMINPECVCW